MSGDRLFWIVWIGPKYSKKNVLIREAEGDLTQADIREAGGVPQVETRVMVATSQGILSVSRSRKRQEIDSWREHSPPTPRCWLRVTVYKFCE